MIFSKFSVIGYNRELYKKWMNIDNFNLILSNLIEIQSYIKSVNSQTQVSTYHLITDNSRINEEIESYKNNVINVVKV